MIKCLVFLVEVMIATIHCGEMKSELSFNKLVGKYTKASSIEPFISSHVLLCL